MKRPGKASSSRSAALALLLGFAVVVGLRPAGEGVARVVSDLASVLGAGWLTWASSRAARRLSGRAAVSWALITLGAAGWTAGELAWALLELAPGEVPFPSVADIGYLMWPLLAGAGLVVRPSAALVGGRRWRAVLDALVVGTSLLAVSWASVLGTVFAASADSPVARVVAIAYPLTDVAMLALVIVVACSTTDRGRDVVALAVGIGLIAVADSVYAYAGATGSYASGHSLDVVWTAGLLGVAQAASRARPSPAAAPSPQLPAVLVALPYVPAAVAAGITGVQAVRGALDPVLVAFCAAILVLLVARQILVVADQRTLQRSVHGQTTRDPLTGLVNRLGFCGAVDTALRDRAEPDAVGVAVVDLTDFGAVNDTLGHRVGDRVLVEVAGRLHAVVRDGDLLARIGGDRFAVLVSGAVDGEVLGRRLIAVFDEPVPVDGRPIVTRAGVGTAVWGGRVPPHDPEVPGVSGDAEPDGVAPTADELLRRADVAVRAARREGATTFRAHTFALDVVGAESVHPDVRAALLADVRAGRIDVALQPITGLEGPYGAEALARWRHGGRWVSPELFVALARRLGVAADLDLGVLERALTSCTAPQLSVNMSPDLLRRPGLAATVATLLARSARPAPRLTVEVLESGVVEDDHAVMSGLAGLRALGVRVSVDDFGTGYSSLARVHRLRPDVVKIDRSLVQDAGADGENLLRGVTALAHGLGALVVAEGVESTTQLAAARRAGCDAFQGYLLGRPALVERAALLAG